MSLCEHIFHKSCLVSYLKSQIEDSHLPLNCPDFPCKLEIGDLDLKELLSEDDYTKYSTFSLNQVVDTNKDMSWCPTADCKFAFIFDPDEEAKGAPDDQAINGHELNCPLCKKHYCLTCKVAYHEGVTCKEYRATHDVEKLDAEFVAFAKGKQFKQCPHCAFWVERSTGCDHMTCRCGKYFCYKCGGIYGKCPCATERMRL